MAKKNPDKKIFDSTSIESADAHAEPTDSVKADQEHELMEKPDMNEESASERSLLSAQPEEEGMEAPAGPDEPLTSAAEEETSAEDLLEDVRQSLIEEEAEKNRKDSKWWRRLGRKGKRVEPEQPPINAEIDLPASLTSADVVEDQVQEPASEESLDELDELIDMLAGTEAAPAEATVTPEVEVPAEPEPEIDFEKLKEQAFQPRPSEESEKVTDVRSVALEDGEEVFVEVEAPVVDPVAERISAFENALKPYRWYVNIAIAFFGVVVIVLVSLIMFNVYQQSRPQATQVSNLPYPTSVSLPGGWSFQLGRGTLQNGNWEPQGAEWLEGTEVCRWVALPWSRQLEAVVRTLNPNDPVELVMSNNDKLVYEVYSIRQLSLQEMQELDSNSPCLLLILTQSDSEEHWVLTALP